MEIVLKELAKQSNNVEEFEEKIKKKLDELWQKVKEAKAEEQSKYTKEMEEIKSIIEKGREKYLVTKELKQIVKKKRITTIESWAIRDVNRLFFKEFLEKTKQEEK
jgi:hypothetical protein